MTKALNSVRLNYQEPSFLKTTYDRCNNMQRTQTWGHTVAIGHMTDTFLVPRLITTSACWGLPHREYGYWQWTRSFSQEPSTPILKRVCSPRCVLQSHELIVEAVLVLKLSYIPRILYCDLPSGHLCWVHCYVKLEYCHEIYSHAWDTAWHYVISCNQLLARCDAHAAAFLFRLVCKGQAYSRNF